MGTKYKAEVSYKYVKQVVVLETVRFWGGSWRIGWRKPNGTIARWRGNNTIFPTEGSAQAALDAEAKKRGFEPIEEV